jgi:hypothetical protein
MEKIDIDFVTKEPNTFDFEGQTIIVDPIMSLENQAALIQQYLSDYFNSGASFFDGLPFDILGADFKLKLFIIDRQTNINITKDGDNEYSKLLVSRVWESVRNNIDNFCEFDMNLHDVVGAIEHERDLKLSVGGVINGLADKLGAMADKLSGVSSDDLKKAIADGQGLLKELENSPASKIFVESSQSKRVQ